MRRYFERAHKAMPSSNSCRAGSSIRFVPATACLPRSMWSSGRGIAASVTSDSDGFPPHIALPDAPPGMVEIWEPTEPDERREIEGWDAPFDQVSETSPRVKLARRIASAVRQLVDGANRSASSSRAVRYGDVLVLVRQRGELFEAVIRALKDEGVAVAGADRLMLSDHIAVMDLIALADALLLPEDDLALATVLRSPLFGFERRRPFRDRVGSRSAIAARRATRKASEREKFSEAAALLDKLRRSGAAQDAFCVLRANSGARRARRRFLARLGHEANDALDEFLNIALDYERRETPSLQGFLAWLRQARAEVKRDMEIARDEVRVMTVHGAKGLEAPIVILADTMTPPAGPKPPRLLALADGATIWAGRKADDAPAVASARQSALADAERRISSAAVRRHDARCRPADHLRCRRRKQAPSRLLVRSHSRRARPAAGRGQRR